MKICWDMLEGTYLTRNGTFRKSSISYVYKESCIKCGEPYLTPKCKQSNFCGKSCAKKNYKFSEKAKKNMSIAQVGKTLSTKTKKKISTAVSGENNPMYGKTHIAAVRKKLSEVASKRIGVLNANYRGGAYTLGLTTYETCKDTLGLYEEIRKQEGTEVLEVKCTYCGRWFSPTYISVSNRFAAINNIGRGEGRLYCSENCKFACPVYKKVKYPKGFKHTTSREVDPYLRQMVFELDNWTCQKCGATGGDVILHCHHILGYAQNKMFANDVNNCITLCKDCHKMIHSRIGCRYVDLQCERGGIGYNESQ